MNNSAYFSGDIVKPPEVNLSDWSLRNLFEDKAQDPQNFNLSDDATSVLIALLTGLSMLLITDIVFRFTVRATKQHISTYVLYRFSLLSRVANPMSWHTLVRSPKIPFKAMKSSYSRPQRFPRWQKGMIATVGMVLSVAQLLLIFLATDREYAYELDKRAMPAFQLESRPQAAVVRPVLRLCTSHELVTKNGFDALATLLLCTSYIDFYQTKQLPSILHASVSLSMLGKSSDLSIIVSTQRMARIYSQEVGLVLDDGKQYVSKVNVSFTDAQTVLSRLFQARGHKVLMLAKSDTEEKDGRWVVSFDLLLNADDLPASFLLGPSEQAIPRDERGNRTFAAEAWNQHLASIVRGQLTLSGRREAQEHWSTTPKFLHDNADAQLVVRRRPRLSIAFCIALTGTLVVVWIFVALVPKWKPTVDYTWVWGRIFAVVTQQTDSSDAPGDSSVDYSDVSLFSTSFGSFEPLTSPAGSAIGGKI